MPLWNLGRVQSSVQTLGHQVKLSTFALLIHYIFTRIPWNLVWMAVLIKSRSNSNMCHKGRSKKKHLCAAEEVTFSTESSWKLLTMFFQWFLDIKVLIRVTWSHSYVNTVETTFIISVNDQITVCTSYFWPVHCQCTRLLKKLLLELLSVWCQPTGKKS